MQAAMYISSITIQNIKNVTYGHVDLSSSKHVTGANIMGIYGQNGSGKTVFIEAIHILKCLLLGQKIPEEYNNWISVDEEKGALSFEIVCSNGDEITTIFYDVALKRGIVTTTDPNTNEDTERLIMTVESESIQYKKTGQEAVRKTVIMNTASSANEVIMPKQRLSVLFSNYEDIHLELLVQKHISVMEARSFLFSKFFKDKLTLRSNNESRTSEYEDLLKPYEMVIQFAQNSLFVVKTSHSALHGLNILPLEMHYKDSKTNAVGTITLPLHDSLLLPAVLVEHIEFVIEKMNIVLTKIIPDLKIGLEVLSTEATDDGEIGKRIFLVSYKPNKMIPLRNESEGIRKIISILSLLIAVYNNRNIVVAIDELDAGIFEYLLGELLKILSDRGKGQLIFTSHNLRPLETLHKSCIVVTTTNPENRYIRLTNVKSTNNLRSFYYRDIILGEQKEEVYHATDNEEIAYALGSAGRQ
ncbi:AAA family ATPase [Veillonella sp. 3913]|uniref:AAA family ATPase n=1 Tax=Veillonella sp. 3913 TaxID=2490952 RepID=UPI000F8F8217|nr:AAA family ATPase [Veillonella sp. 3913]